MKEVRVTDTVTMYVMESREDWLGHRGRIGGSDAASVIGRNPWRSNQELWRIKTGREISPDISDKPYVRYGTEAEPHIRALFALDHEELTVKYVENNLFTNSAYPFAHASLDGWTEDSEGRRGVLEIKTTTISSRLAAEKWRDRIPDNYFCQVLHYLMVTGFDFADLRAHLKIAPGFAEDREYHIERSDCEEDIAYLAEKEREFWAAVESDTEPPLLLPEI
ncbi:MAG: lambda-exonuclease family protein [Eubacterium sp.]